VRLLNRDDGGGRRALRPGQSMRGATDCDVPPLASAQWHHPTRFSGACPGNGNMPQRGSSRMLPLEDEGTMKSMPRLRRGRKSVSDQRAHHRPSPSSAMRSRTELLRRWCRPPTKMPADVTNASTTTEHEAKIPASQCFESVNS
jgi:hypothetical protein